MSQSTQMSNSGGAAPQGPILTLCTECGEPIPVKRLQATNGRAQQCVPCLEKLGDVQPLRRFDESLPSGEVVSQLFVQNPYIEQQMQRVNSCPAPDSAFEIAVGDDSFLIRENSSPDNDKAYNMVSAFEEDINPSVVPNTIHNVN